MKVFEDMLNKVDVVVVEVKVVFGGLDILVIKLVMEKLG